MDNEKNEISAKTEAASVESPNWKLVQITVDSDEMKRRINKFITRKKGEGAEWNVQEFCGRSYIDEQDPVCENLDSCARVDAAFVQRRGLKSHIKVSKVRNEPRTGATKIQRPIENDASMETMNHRLFLMEHHLRLKSDNTLRSNIFQRMKALEDKILYLEGTSPEYFNSLPKPDGSSPKRKIVAKTAYASRTQSVCLENFSAEDVLKKMKKLKEVLKCKKEFCDPQEYKTMLDKDCADQLALYKSKGKSSSRSKKRMKRSRSSLMF